MTYLLDTNIWLERMLDQEHSDDVAALLLRVPPDQLCISDFTLHSIGVILNRLKQPHTFVQFVQDILLDGATRLLTVSPAAMDELVRVATKYRLDFDDAYQYVAAAHSGLSIVSLDSDFDRTDRGRRLPRDIVLELDAEAEDE